MIYLVCALIATGVFAFDIISKVLVENANIDKVIIPNLLKFKFRYNNGASFSFLADKEWARAFFIAITSIVALIMIALYVYAIIKKKKISKWLLVSWSLIFGGTVGNLFDRIFIGQVRDFIFVVYNTDIFPAIFNVADMGIVIGVIMLCVFILFLDDDAVFKFKGNKNGSKKD